MTNGDFIHPTGELTSDMYPGETLATNVDAWIVEAQSKTSDEDARKAWVYYRAFLAVANRFHAEAMIVDISDQVSRTRVLGQAQYWKDRSDQQMDAFLAATQNSGSFAIRSYAPDRTFDDTTIGVNKYGGFV